MFGASKPKDLNRIANIGYGQLWLREGNLSFNNNTTNNNNNENYVLAKKVIYGVCSTTDDAIKIYISNTFTVLF